MKNLVVILILIVVLIIGFGLMGGGPGEFTSAPLPEAAGGVAIDPEKGYIVEQLGEGLYWVGDGTYQMMFLTTGVGVVVVDDLR